jgi:hypothetical protein
MCLAGSTGSDDFPVEAAFQPSFDGPQSDGYGLTSIFVRCYGIVNQESALSTLEIVPDSVALIAGESIRFSAEGLDQYDQPLVISPQWSATGGEIDAEGTFTASDDAGIFTVTVTDPVSGLSAHAIVNIYSGVDTDAFDIPTEFMLYVNYPNPFNSTTTIRFDAKESSRVVLTLYDVLGRRLATLVDEDYAPGHHEVIFDARSRPSGIYFYQIEMGDFCSTKKMVLLR